MNKSIFDLSDELLQLDELLDTLGDEPDSQIFVLDKYLTNLRGAIEDKLDGYADYIRELEARSEVRKAEAEKILHLSKMDANKAERLKRSLQWFFTIT